MILKQITKSLRYLTTPSLPEQVVSGLCSLMGKSIKICEKLKKEVLKEYEKMEDCDEDKEEQFKEEYEEINDLMGSNIISIEFLITFYT